MLLYTGRVTLDIGERKRRELRVELSEAAVRLVIERGFETTTMEDLATAAGVSRRTFFRYFSSKEDVVFAFLDQWAARLAADIVARPAGENPVVAVQQSFRKLTAAYRDRALVLVRLVGETPALRQQERINREHLRSAVVNALAIRLRLDAKQDMRPTILATIAFAPLAAPLSWSVIRSREEVGNCFDEALAAFNRERDRMCAEMVKRRPRSGAHR